MLKRKDKQQLLEEQDAVGPLPTQVMHDLSCQQRLSPPPSQASVSKPSRSGGSAFLRRITVDPRRISALKAKTRRNLQEKKSQVRQHQHDAPSHLVGNRT